jgi:hypothetical protein
MTDRSNLQRAHAELAEAEQRLRRIETALDRSLSPGLSERRERAERLLAEARNSEPDRWITALVEGGPRPSAVASAEAALEKIVAEEEAGIQQRRMMRSELARQHDIVESARLRLKLEIAAMVSRSPGAVALIDELARCEQRIRDISATVAASPPGCFPIGNRVLSDVGGVADPAWAAAIAALERDPQTLLPAATDVPA